MSILFLPVLVIGKVLAPVLVPIGLRFGWPRWLHWWHNREDVPDWQGDTWWALYRWYAFRNAFHNGSEELLGFHRLEGGIVYDNGADPSDWEGRSGLRVMVARVDRWWEWAVMFRLVLVYPGRRRCLEWGWGWKLWEVESTDDDPWVNYYARLPHPWRAVGSPANR